MRHFYSVFAIKDIFFIFGTLIKVIKIKRFKNYGKKKHWAHQWRILQRLLITSANKEKEGLGRFLLEISKITFVNFE